MLNQPYLYDGNWSTAFSLKALRQSSVQFVRPIRFFFEGCYARQTGIPRQLLEMGASEVVSSRSVTVNNRLRIGPAGDVGFEVVRAWLEEKDVDVALSRVLAKHADREMEFVVER